MRGHLPRRPLTGKQLPLLAISVLLATGCAGPRGPEPAADRDAAVASYQDRAQRLADLAGWRLQGRATVDSDQGSGQVRIRWSHQGREGRLAVSNPFGQTLMVLHHNPQGLRLRDREGRTYRGRQAREVLRQRLGSWVPVDRFSGWALGLPARGEEPPASLDERGLPLALEVAPWAVAYTDYRRTDGVWLPASMEISREGVQLRIRVDQWDLEWREGTEAGGAV